MSDHAAIDIARLTINLLCPWQRICRVLINIFHDDWVRKWVDISIRGLVTQSLQETLIIGISSAGNSKIFAGT